MVLNADNLIIKSIGDGEFVLYDKTKPRKRYFKAKWNGARISHRQPISKEKYKQLTLLL